jgi:hypothetical protein
MCGITGRNHHGYKKKEAEVHYPWNYSQLLQEPWMRTTMFLYPVLTLAQHLTL